MVFNDKVKASFDKVREEMWLLKQELTEIRHELSELRVDLSDLKAQDLTRELPPIKPNFITQISSGNKGVPADRQTDTPTFDTPSFPVDGTPTTLGKTPAHIPAHSSTHPQHILAKLQHFDTSLDKNLQKITKTQQINELSGLIDTLKNDLQKKFKSLTKQEFYVFSVLFTLDKNQPQTTYQDLAVSTNLTSSSIRDYIQRIIKKGIPITKEKLNNKLTILKIPSELRNLATLDSLIRLRGDFQDSNLDKFS